MMILLHGKMQDIASTAVDRVEKHRLYLCPMGGIL